MLKFGASQHFQEVSHEPPGTERGEKSVGDDGTGVGGCARVRVCVYVCVRCVGGEGAGVGDWMRGGVVGMAWWWYVLGEAWQHGHRASLIPLLWYHL